MYAIFGKLKAHRTAVVITSIIVVFCCLLIMVLWPSKCSYPIRQSEPEFIFYFTTQAFSDECTLPELSSQQWTIRSDSDEYKELLDIMDRYRYHIAFSLTSKNNHSPWMTVYASDGTPILKCMGTNYIEISNAACSICGQENNGFDMVNAILSYLQSTCP